MRILFVALFLACALFGDFYIVSGEKKVKMTPLVTGKIDFSTFAAIASVKRGDEALHAIGDEVAFNHKHLNFRLATIGFTQTNYSLGEWSKKAKESENTYYIDFDNYTREDGVMLQLFYKNNWYSVVLGEPLKILHEMFAHLDAKGLDVHRALIAVKQAREAFPEDEILKNAEKTLHKRRADNADKSAKDTTPNNKPVKVFFN